MNIIKYKECIINENIYTVHYYHNIMTSCWWHRHTLLESATCLTNHECLNNQ